MNLEQQLHAALAPAEPGPEPLAAVMAQLSTRGRPALHGRRRWPGRRILFGTILVAAAAAAMLAVQLFGSVEQPATSLPPAQQHVAAANAPTAPTPIVNAVPGVEEPAVAAVKAVDKAPAVAPAPRNFTVFLQPLSLQTEDPGLGVPLREFYSSVLDQLRAVPGLVLVATERSGSTPDELADFRFTLTGRPLEAGTRGVVVLNSNGEIAAEKMVAAPPPPVGQWRMEVRVEASRTKHSLVRAEHAQEPVLSGFVQVTAGGAFIPMLAPPQGATTDTTQSGQQGAGDYVLVLGTTYNGGLSSDCRQSGHPELVATTCDPAFYAKDLIGKLRMNVFPVDSDMERMLQARVLDRDQSFATRLAYLGSLQRLQERKPATGSNAELALGALDLLTAAPDVASRMKIWRLLRGQPNAALVQPLLDLARQEPDSRMRMEAVTMLIEDYKTDPVARAGLESIANSDATPLVRKMAERARSGEAGWRAYVATTARDGSLSALARFEPLAYMIQSGRIEEARQLLDANVIAGLIDVLPPLLKEPANRDAINLLGNLGSVREPAVVGLLLASLDSLNSETTVFVRRIVVGMLVQRRDEPRARKRLEEIAASDPDGQLRQVAAKALQSAPTTAP